jgi:prevent-host-death family protein
MPRTVNLQEARTQLSALVKDAALGDEIVIAYNGIPAARLVRIEMRRRRRRLQTGVSFMPDDCEAPDAETERLYDEA